MQFQVQNSTGELIQGDIVGQQVVAIVNAANSEIELVRFVLWDATALKAYERAARELFVA